MSTNRSPGYFTQPEIKLIQTEGLTKEIIEKAQKSVRCNVDIDVIVSLLSHHIRVNEGKIDKNTKKLFEWFEKNGTVDGKAKASQILRNPIEAFYLLAEEYLKSYIQTTQADFKIDNAIKLAEEKNALKKNK